MRKSLIIAAALLAACTNADTVTEAPTSETIYDEVAPEITKWMAQPAILVFSKTRQWRHNEGIAGGDRFFADLSAELGYGLYTTENGAVFNSEDLARFKVIVFNNMTGDTLSPSQRGAFKAWLENGGAWIGLHSAGDSSHKSWPWYDKALIGPEFIGHPAGPQFQDARLVNLKPDHPIMNGIPSEWVQNDEWYSFDGVPQDYNLTPLVGLDETTYSPKNDVYGDVSDLRMGETPIQHPVVWVGTFGDGKTVYSAIGHSHTSYDYPIYTQLLKNAFAWVTGD